MKCLNATCIGKMRLRLTVAMSNVQCVFCMLTVGKHVCLHCHCDWPCVDSQKSEHAWSRSISDTVLATPSAHHCGQNSQNLQARAVMPCMWLCVVVALLLSSLTKESFGPKKKSEKLCFIECDSVCASCMNQNQLFDKCAFSDLPLQGFPLQGSTTVHISNFDWFWLTLRLMKLLGWCTEIDFFCKVCTC